MLTDWFKKLFGRHFSFVLAEKCNILWKGGTSVARKNANVYLLVDAIGNTGGEYKEVRGPDWVVYRNGNICKAYWVIASSGMLLHIITK